MAKWGSFKWGDGTKWGTGDPAPALPAPDGRYLWMLLINWDGNWTNEARYCKGARCGNRGRVHYIAQGGETFEKIQPAEFYFTMVNKDRRFDPYNTSSPLNGNVEPGKEVIFQVKDTETGTTHSIFFGRIRDIRPVSGEGETEIIVLDPLQLMADSDVSSFETRFNITVSEAISNTLRQDNLYPYPIEVGSSSCPITYFNPGEANAFDVLRQLEDAGLGTMFVDRKGTFHYYPLNTTGQTVHTLTQDMLLKVIPQSQPWENIRNRISVTANRYGYGVTQEMWRSDESIYVEAGSVRQLKIEFAEGRLIQPVKGVDYLDDARPVVSGGVISWGNYFDAWLSSITSTAAMLNIANRDPSSAQWLAWIVIRGNPIVNKKISFESVDGASMAKYGRRALKIDTPYLQDRGHAEAYASLLEDFLKGPHKDVIVEIETRPEAFPIDLLDRVHLDVDALGIDDTFDVGRIDFQWLNDTGQAFRYRIYLHNILYSSATITPTPYIPGNPPVPINPGPGGPGGSATNPGEGGPTYQQTMTCLEDLVPAGPNGPYTTGANTMISNEPGGASYNAGLWFRSQYNPYRTWVTIDGIWQSLVDGVWVEDASWDFDGIEAYDTTNHLIFTGLLSANGKVANGVRWYYWNNTLKYYVKNITFRFGEIGLSFVPKETLYTGTVQATDADGVKINGLTVGGYYALASSGGPWHAGGEPANAYDWTLSDALNPSPDSPRGAGWEGAFGKTNGGTMALENAAPVVFSESIDGTYARAYFKAAQSFIHFRVQAYYPNNTGSLGYTLLRAENNGGTKRVIVRSVNFYNVCKGAASSSPA
jgi:hypothetical protein